LDGAGCGHAGCGPEVEYYAAAVKVAALGRCNSVLIDTLPEHEISWIKFIQESHPGLPLLVRSVPHGHA
jgi:hypothetical protein